MDLSRVRHLVLRAQDTCSDIFNPLKGSTMHSKAPDCHISYSVLGVGVTEDPSKPPGAHIVHERLREHWLINLIVAMFPVAHEIYHDISPPCLPPLCCQLAHTHHGFHVIPVHMENWCANGLCNISAVWGGARVLGVCGESHLIIHNQVHAATYLVIGQLAEIQGFKDNTLNIYHSWYIYHSSCIVWMSLSF
jgi:hypothetical protein